MVNYKCYICNKIFNSEIDVFNHLRKEEKIYNPNI